MVDDEPPRNTLQGAAPAPPPPAAASAVSDAGAATLATLGDPGLLATAVLPADATTLAAGTSGGGAAGTETYVSPPGYQLGAVIGRGGMGEVVVANCQRIGREVAIKRMRAIDPPPDEIARFLREARIQARLDHPAIVPVHELGYDADGRPYFTMKRVTGITVSDLLARGGASQQRLLRAFVDVCLAIELAHSRGVVHRDLKPSNIMLGDFGEVYVLDWGVARVLSDARDRASDFSGPLNTDPEIPTLDGKTQTGAMLGTPGYMAPEQARGDEVGTPADVYALGSMLFEILAVEPLHPRGHAAIAATIAAGREGPGGPAARRKDGSVPPELDAVCIAALATDPAARPRARELADRVQRYLDGDRDVERRRNLAAEQLAAARDALASTDPDARGTAMRRAGRALALDPESRDAAAVVSALMLEPPAVLPPELVASLDDEERTFGAERSKNGTYALLSTFLILLLLPWLNVRSWMLLAGCYAMIVATALTTWTAYRRRRSQVIATMVMAIGLAVVFTRVIGPLVLTPVVMCGVLLSITANPTVSERPWLLFAWTAAVALVPVGLEGLGVLAPSWGISNDTFWSRSAMFKLDEFAAIALVATNLLFMTVIGFFALKVTRGRRTAQRHLHVQAWHLGQLLPSAKRGWITRGR